MKLTSQHTQVLIIGAGPSGLMMAAQLLRYGVQPIIIDSKQGPTDKTKALAVQARSLEIYRQMGLVEPVLKGGKPAKGLQFHLNGRLGGTFSISDSGEELTPYPYILMYPQSKNERVLLNDLTQNVVPVYWNTSLEEITQSTDKVEATILSDGVAVKITSDWLIGADGAHSAVRKQLNIPFNGDTYKHLFYLADIISAHEDDYVGLYLNNHGFAGLFPTPDKNGFRIIGSLPAELGKEQDITLDDVLPFAEKVKGSAINVKRLNWFTTYKLSHRMAEKFSLGRCFLIGDAAHIHSPVGGQGMNTGLQDAYNLAWKLGGVITGKLHASILNTYAEERMPVAKQLLKTTDRAFNLIMSSSVLARLFKKFVLPRILRTIWGSAKFKQTFFKRVSQIDINYRHSRINMDLSQAVKIKAGDRLPYLKLWDEKKQINTDLHAWCTKPGFTLLILGKLSEQELLSFARWITHFYGPGMNFFYLPSSEKNQHIFSAFEVKSNHLKTLIVRPDNYIGFMSDSTDIDIINNYLQNTAGLIRIQHNLQ